MNSSKKDRGRIIKQAVLLSEKPTKKGVCFVVFFHAVMLALIVVGVLSRNPLVQLMGMMGVCWFALIARGLVIELTNNSDRHIWQLVNQVLRRAKSSTINDALLGLLIVAIALLIAFVFSIVAVVSGVFWLFYIGIGGAIAVIIAYTIWHIGTIARQVKAQRLKDNT